MKEVYVVFVENGPPIACYSTLSEAIRAIKVIQKDDQRTFNIWSLFMDPSLEAVQLMQCHFSQ